MSCKRTRIRRTKKSECEKYTETPVNRTHFVAEKLIVGEKVSENKCIGDNVGDREAVNDTVEAVAVAL